jgi:hypothetical protein
LIIQVPSNQKVVSNLRLEGGVIGLNVSEDLTIETLHVISTSGDSKMGTVKAGRVSLRIRGGNMDAVQIECQDFKALLEAGSLAAPTAGRSSIVMMSGSLDMSVAEELDATVDLVVNAGKAKIEVPESYEGELSCDVSGGDLLGNGQKLPDDYRQRGVTAR